MRWTAACFALLPLLSFAGDEPAGDRWAEDMRRFAQSDREHPFPEGGVVFTGSSSIRLWDLEKSFSEAEPLNRGFGGSQIPDAVRHLDLLVLRHKPRVVVLYSGDNDINAGRTAEQVVADFQAFVAGVHAALPDTKIVYIAIKPSLARWKLADEMHRANSGIEAWCEKTTGCEYVDVWSAMLGDDGKPRKELFVEDGLHLSPEGYELWTKLVGPHLEPDATAANSPSPAGNAR